MAFPQQVDDRRWLQDVAGYLSSCRAQKGFRRYTRPMPGATGLQAPFASALFSMIYRWYDGEMAVDELRSAAAGQPTEGLHAGLIPALYDWDAGDARTTEAAPPLLAVSTVAVYHMTGDSNLIEKLYPQLGAFHDWLDTARERDGALVIPASAGETLRAALDPLAPVDGDISDSDIVAFNALRVADLDAVAHLAYDLGQPDAQATWEARAEAVRTALAAYAGADGSPLTLFAKAAPAEAAEAMAAAVRDAEPWGPTYSAGSAVPRVSMVYNWLVYVGLRQYDLRPAANALAERSLRLLEHGGYHAWYDATTGTGAGGAGAVTAALALDMLYRERQTLAPGSHCI